MNDISNFGQDLTPRTDGGKPRSQLDIDDYLTATADASSRTRAVLIILVVASVLALTGLFNSLQTQWMHARMMELGNPSSKYMKSKIGGPPQVQKLKDPATYAWALELYKKRQEALCTAVETAYVNGSLVILVPFFGFTFDVNDLALLSSIGFLIILSCYRFFLAREIDNLRISFAEARRHSNVELENFYNLLAMRQVFTIPESEYINRSTFLRYAPKAITWLPCILLLAIIVHDWLTEWIGQELKLDRFIIEEFMAIVGFVFLFAISWVITKRLVLMDKIWNVVHCRINCKPEDVVSVERQWDMIFSKQR